MLRHVLGGVGWGVMMTFFAFAHMLDAAPTVMLLACPHMVDATACLGWGGIKFLHIERKITSVVNSLPPSHYIRKHAPG